ncbi:Alpha-L-rhamnosidase [Penicillium longicatenatum]|nr:Alpha-L-rhamnosidase [Penicillium longicatenatum]
MLVFPLLFSLTLLWPCQGSTLSILPGSQRTEALLDPIAIGEPYPRLSWQLTSSVNGATQVAYQVRVKNAADQKQTILWDSGKVISQDPAALYGGEALGSRTQASWQVRAWDQNGIVTAWSEPAKFEIGLLDSQEWIGYWITNPNFELGTTSLPIFAKTFEVSCEVSHARLYLIGLGLHSATINGHSVSQGVLAPGYTNLNKTKYYSTYDVTSAVSKGANLLGVELGRGYYDAQAALDRRYMKFTTSAKPLMLLSQLEYTCKDGKSVKIGSDSSWRSNIDGPLLESSWYGGEEYDARLEIPGWPTAISNSSSWQSVARASPPPGDLVPQPYAELAIVEDIPCVSVTKVGTSGWTFDFGVNFAGWVELQISEPADTRVAMWPAEIVSSHVWADQSTTGKPIFDAFTSNGTTYTYSQKFMYHGMRYLSVNLTQTPSATDAVGHSIRQSVDKVGEVNSSSDLFNSIHGIIDRSIQSNLYSTLTDCPHREKLGWLEQDHLMISPIMWSYDVQAMLQVPVQDIVDSQQNASSFGNVSPHPGFIPEIAPEFQVFPYPFRDDPNWGGAVVLLPLQHYKEYGDARILSRQYSAMTSYLSYLEFLTTNYTLHYGLGDWETLDDCTGSLIPATYGFQQAAQGMAQVARYLSYSDDAEYYQELADEITSALHTATFNASEAVYGCGSQGALALALDMGAPPTEEIYARVLDNLVGLIVNNTNHWSVGEIALPALFRVLHNNGYDELLYTLMSQTTAPSYGYEVVNGATSLWEAWDGTSSSGSSMNHLMFGYGDVWLSQLSGLQQVNTSVAWNSINFYPALVGNMTTASANHMTPRGLASAAWTLESDEFRYNITVPIGSKGHVYLPAKRNGTVITSYDGSYSPVVVGSGSHFFIVA